ncbi:hypothetical protein BJV78DRAFT_1255685 [Lactifluus subvellereus]|nr:hypothetical protein BJV78DRAFT_1255685 [Lactifluus subvellereus]
MCPLQLLLLLSAVSSAPAVPQQGDQARSLARRECDMSAQYRTITNVVDVLYNVVASARGSTSVDGERLDVLLPIRLSVRIMVSYRGSLEILAVILLLTGLNRLSHG